MKFENLTIDRRFLLAFYAGIAGKRDLTIKEIDAVYLAGNKGKSFPFPVTYGNGRYPLFFIKTEFRTTRGVYTIPEFTEEDIRAVEAVYGPIPKTVGVILDTAPTVELPANVEPVNEANNVESVGEGKVEEVSEAPTRSNRSKRKASAKANEAVEA